MEHVKIAVFLISIPAFYYITHRTLLKRKQKTWATLLILLTGATIIELYYLCTKPLNMYDQLDLKRADVLHWADLGILEITLFPEKGEITTDTLEAVLNSEIYPTTDGYLLLSSVLSTIFWLGAINVLGFHPLFKAKNRQRRCLYTVSILSELLARMPNTPLWYFPSIPLTVFEQLELLKNLLPVGALYIISTVIIEQFTQRKHKIIENKKLLSSEEELRDLIKVVDPDTNDPLNSLKKFEIKGFKESNEYLELHKRTWKGFLMRVLIVVVSAYFLTLGFFTD